MAEKKKQIDVQCLECKNVNTLFEDEAKVGRWFECKFCGTTYEITGIRPDGSLELRMIEEEK